MWVAQSMPRPRDGGSPETRGAAFVGAAAVAQHRPWRHRPSPSGRRCTSRSVSSTRTVPPSSDDQASMTRVAVRSWRRAGTAPPGSAPALSPGRSSRAPLGGRNEAPGRILAGGPEARHPAQCHAAHRSHGFSRADRALELPRGHEDPLGDVAAKLDIQRTAGVQHDRAHVVDARASARRPACCLRSSMCASRQRPVLARLEQDQADRPCAREAAEVGRVGRRGRQAAEALRAKAARRRAQCEPYVANSGGTVTGNFIVELVGDTQNESGRMVIHAPALNRRAMRAGWRASATGSGNRYSRPG